MSARTARWIAWAIVAIYFILAAIGLTLQGIARAPYAQTPLPALVFLVSLVGVWIVTGALVISRHPRHPVGWLLCAGLFTGAMDMFAAGYTAYDSHLSPGSLPGVDLALVWLKLVNLGPHGVVVFTLLVLLFPDGRFLSSGWRKVAWTTVGALLLFLPLQAVEPGVVDPVLRPLRTNPLGIGASSWAVLKPAMWFAFSVLVLCYGAAFVSLIIRLRSSRGDVRQQIKWLLFPVGLFGIFVLLFIVGLSTADDAIVGIGVVVGQLAIASIVIAVAFAIFKYRLYDIDLIISRTLVYGTLTAILALVYYSVVLLLQQAVPSESPVAVVSSTLVVAALFTPLRRRIQRIIDRRFYRRKYDAIQTLEAFNVKVRDEVELEKLCQALLATVEETMQPAHLSLWLK